jgi:hypothetical protein
VTRGTPKLLCPRKMPGDIAGALNIDDAWQLFRIGLEESGATIRAEIDDPDAVPARAHIQVAERIKWMERLTNCPRSSATGHAGSPVECITKGMTSASGHRMVCPLGLCKSAGRREPHWRAASRPART